MLGGSHSAYTQYAIFRNRGLASRSGGRPGDLVVFGYGSHIGISLGDGRVISARPVAYASAGRTIARSRTRYTRTAVVLRATASIAGTRLAVLPMGTRVVVLRSTRDRLGRLWDEVHAPTGRIRWLANWLLRA